MAKFDIVSVLGDVSKLNTETEQIIRIPLDQIDPDPNNFYSLEGIEDLAGSIELIGLQQPLRVRPNGDRWIIVSGHRRRAACMLIRDGGSDVFASGVPCIPEYGEASPAMQELRLIYANAMTRILSAAELSKQAERVTELLYELKNQGVEFSGRMREHVAKACQVSESKLARLHAIRTNLDPGLLSFFDGGALTEDAAYHLSRLPAEVQRRAVEKIENDKKFRAPTGAVVQKVIKQLDVYDTNRPCPAHAGGPQCHHLHEVMIKDLFQRYDWDVCSCSFCCMDCVRNDMCSKACKEAKDKVKLKKAAEAENEAKRKAEEAEARRARSQKICRRAEALLPLIDAAKLKDGTKLYDDWQAASVADVRAWARGETDGKVFYSEACLLPNFTRDLIAMAKRLKCSPMQILDPSAPAAKEPAPKIVCGWWRAGIPSDGLYACKFKLFTDTEQIGIFRHKDGSWWIGADAAAPISQSCNIVAYCRLPEEDQT